jgi:uncharacterized secreted protein with C-terminal beta-propeller domain
MRFPAFAVYIDTKKLATYTVLAFVLGSLLGGAMWNLGGIYVPKPPISTSLDLSPLCRFTSREELKDFIRTRATQKANIYMDEINGLAFSISSARTAADSAKAAASAAGEGAPPPDYSGTNIQVEGVDEADLVKTDGMYIYLAREDTVVIVRAYPPEEAEVVTRLRLYQWVQDLFVSGDKLVVFLRISKNVFREIAGYNPPPNLEARTTIMVFDISDRASPEKEREVTVDGYYFNSRMIGDYVYAIVREEAWIVEDDVRLPCFTSEKAWWEVEPTDVYYVNQSDAGFVYTSILAINIQDPEEEFAAETFLLGAASNLYVSLGNIYIATGRWSDKTTIYKIGIDEGVISYVADGAVPGRVLNQFSMDEYGGYFRIATTNGRVTRNGASTSNNVYVLNGSLGVVGWLEGLAPGERIYSARFMGDRCYLVTFKKVDPLFAIDVSDPFEPRVLGKLKIPGYSDYLHPYDEDHLIGIGKETVEAEEGDFAWHQGVKISLFDVSDVSKPKEVAKMVIGDRGSDSPALHDHKAFLFSRRRKLLIIPILETEIDDERISGPIPPHMYGDFVFQGAYVFDISPKTGISVRGRVTHLDDSDDLLKSGYWFESDYSVERSLYIGEVLYTVSARMIKMNYLSDLSEAGRVDLS